MSENYFQCSMKNIRASHSLRDSFETSLPCTLPCLVHKLGHQLKAPQFLRLTYTGGYQGSVNSDGFKMRCIGTSSGDFRSSVVVLGSFEATDHGVRVVVRIRHGLHWIVITWICLLLFLSSLGVLLWDYFFDRSKLELALAFPLLALCFYLKQIRRCSSDLEQVRNTVKRMLSLAGQSEVQDAGGPMSTGIGSEASVSTRGIRE